MAALKAGKHIVVDKPMALDEAEAEQMVQVAEEADLINVVNTELRFNLTRQRMKALVENGYLGRLFHVSVSSYHDYRARPYGWKDTAQAGVIRGHGPHMVDLVRWLFGEFGEVAGGVVATFLSSSLAIRPRLNTDFERAYMRLEAFGERGSLVLDLDDRLYGARPGQDQWADLTEPEPLLGLDGIRRRVWDLSFVRLARTVTAAIWREGSVEPAATFRDGLAVTRMLDGALRLFQPAG